VKQVGALFHKILLPLDLMSLQLRLPVCANLLCRLPATGNQHSEHAEHEEGNLQMAYAFV
jgi:hypothetical protein